MDKADIKKFETVFREIAYLLHLLYHEREKRIDSTGKAVTCKLCMKYNNMEIGS